MILSYKNLVTKKFKIALNGIFNSLSEKGSIV